MEFTQKNLKTCFYVNVYAVLPLFSSLSADQPSYIRKKQQILRGGWTPSRWLTQKHNKFPNKIRIADRKSTTTVHVSEGSPRTALVNISAIYTGFTQLFPFQFHKAQGVTAQQQLPHHTPPTPHPHDTEHLPRARKVLGLSRAAEKAAAHPHFPSHPLSVDGFMGSITKSKTSPIPSHHLHQKPAQSLLGQQQPQHLCLQSCNSTQGTTSRPGHQPAQEKLNCRCPMPGKESKAPHKEPKSFPAENGHPNVKYRPGSTLSTSPSRYIKELDKEKRIIITLGEFSSAPESQPLPEIQTEPSTPQQMPTPNPLDSS